MESKFQEVRVDRYKLITPTEAARVPEYDLKLFRSYPNILMTYDNYMWKKLTRYLRSYTKKHNLSFQDYVISTVDTTIDVEDLINRIVKNDPSLLGLKGTNEQGKRYNILSVWEDKAGDIIVTYLDGPFTTTHTSSREMHMLILDGKKYNLNKLGAEFNGVYTETIYKETTVNISRGVANRLKVGSVPYGQYYYVTANWELELIIGNSNLKEKNHRLSKPLEDGEFLVIYNDHTVE